MKNSTMMIISAIAIILISLTAYNFSIRTSYRNGDYKNPFYGLTHNRIDNVSGVKLNCSNKISCSIRQGKKVGLYLSERIKDKVSWHIEKGDLMIDLTDEAKKADFEVYDDDLLIVLNNLEQIRSKPYFRPGGENEKGFSGKVSISGFKQDSMKIDLGISSSAVLDSLNVGTLSASIGGSGTEFCRLSLNSGVFGTAVFRIPGAGSLNLTDPQITKTEYHLSPRATVSLNGKPLQAIQD